MARRTVGGGAAGGEGVDARRKGWTGGWGPRWAGQAPSTRAERPVAIGCWATGATEDYLGGERRGEGRITPGGTGPRRGGCERDGGEGTGGRRSTAQPRNAGLPERERDERRGLSQRRPDAPLRCSRWSTRGAQRFYRARPKVTAARRAGGRQPFSRSAGAVRVGAGPIGHRTGGPGEGTAAGEAGRVCARRTRTATKPWRRGVGPHGGVQGSLMGTENGWR